MMYLGAKAAALEKGTPENELKSLIITIAVYTILLIAIDHFGILKPIQYLFKAE